MPKVICLLGLYTRRYDSNKSASVYCGDHQSKNIFIDHMYLSVLSVPHGMMETLTKLSLNCCTMCINVSILQSSPFTVSQIKNNVYVSISTTN
jgi:hypothetical protein